MKKLFLLLALALPVFGQTQHGIQVSWTLPTGGCVLGYDIYRFTTAAPTPVLLGTGGVTVSNCAATSYQDIYVSGTNLVVGTAYTYYAVTVGTGGVTSPASNQATATFLLAPSAVQVTEF